MAKKPEMILVGNLIWACSECGDKIEIAYPEKARREENEKRARALFQKHVRDKHKYFQER